MKKPDVKIQNTIAYQVHLSARFIQYTWKQLMYQNGLDVSNMQWLSLNRLHHQGEMFQSDFVNESFDDRPSVTRMLASMEKKGWIIREPDAIDNRKRRIRLTSHGEEIYGKLNMLAREHRKKLYKGLTDNDLAELKRILGRLNKNVLEIKNFL